MYLQCRKSEFYLSPLPASAAQHVSPGPPASESGFIQIYTVKGVKVSACKKRGAYTFTYRKRVIPAPVID
jgi:hypothetical protein